MLCRAVRRALRPGDRGGAGVDAEVEDINADLDASMPPLTLTVSFPRTVVDGGVEEAAVRARLREDARCDGM